MASSLNPFVDRDENSPHFLEESYTPRGLEGYLEGQFSVLSTQSSLLTMFITLR